MCTKIRLVRSICYIAFCFYSDFVEEASLLAYCPLFEGVGISMCQLFVSTEVPPNPPHLNPVEYHVSYELDIQFTQAKRNV